MRRYIPLLVLLIAPTAWAQDSSTIDRLSRLERDMGYLQRQIYQNGASASGAPIDSGNAAQLQVRLTAIEEEMRRLRGEVERVNYENQRIGAEYKKYIEDTQYRLQALEQKQIDAAMNATAAAEADIAAAAAEEQVSPQRDTPDLPATYTPSAPVAAEEPSPTGDNFPNSNEHYNHAFKLMNEKNYSAAATSFDDFVKKYPKDPLASNAYYWLGESHYVRGDYTRAAEGFRKGFETNPKGQKAPDNLLKLALSLSNIKREKEACVVLGQLISKYGDTSPRVSERATNERARLQCK